jgi:hypothetical protein
MTERPTPEHGETLTVSGVIGHAEVVVIESAPLEAAAATDEQREAFTRGDFEAALDKVSRPVKGKYADVPYSSEDLIREKRTETQLEDR